MRFPVGKNQKDFESNWYNAQGYAAKTSYGYHEGDDFNLKTGGDSDLGQPLYAIADGTVTSVHHHTTSPTFGRHLHIKHEGAWGVCYSHYAHCDSITVKTGDRVSEGQVIGTLGKSGTKYAHLHFAIKKKPTGIDSIARTKTALNSGWYDPTEFINKWRNHMPESGKIEIETSKFEELVTKSSKYDAFMKAGYSDPAEITRIFEENKRQIASITTEKNNALKDVEEYRKRLNDLIAYTARTLGTRQDETEIRTAIEQLSGKIGELEDLTTELEELKVVTAKEKQSLKDEIAVLKAKLEASNPIDQYTALELLQELVKRFTKILARN